MDALDTVQIKKTKMLGLPKHRVTTVTNLYSDRGCNSFVHVKARRSVIARGWGQLEVLTLEYACHRGHVAFVTMIDASIEHAIFELFGHLRARSESY
jgi:hypothetical protein